MPSLHIVSISTLDELSAVHFAGCNLERDDVALQLSARPSFDQAGEHTAASLRSLMGIPIVLVMFANREKEYGRSEDQEDRVVGRCKATL